MGNRLARPALLWLVLLFCFAGLSAACSPPTETVPPPTTAVPTRTPLRVNTLPPSTPTLGTLAPSTRTPVTVDFDAVITPTPTCIGAPPARLILNERGRVADDDPRPLNVRSGPGTDFRIFGRLEVGDVFVVLEGPLCGGGYTWFRVQRGILEGWIAEGDPGIYYAEPFLPG